MKDVSILIVHYNTPGLLRQTLKGIVRAGVKVSYEVIVVDNNPLMRIDEMVRKEFPEVRLIMSDRNLGFGVGMNKAIEQANGRYLFVFNPDIILTPGSVEGLMDYMETHPKVGMVGPELRNPDGSHQNSCYRFSKLSTIIYRRVPFLRSLKKAKAEIQEYLMADTDHAVTQEVDYILGAAMFVRRQAYEQVGGFDPEFFVYFEDQDWCRRFWQAGWKVVYHPAVHLIHYHRRETAEGGFIKQLLNPLTRIQIKSAVYYYKKYKEDSPR
ncbi:glycosyltransferase family 2 protein [Candidatus Uhrbacteria bacterium]|jgi:GT2 family glycosyltransferase|nr:glycosyltransferase family 2 protein [Candidatus Uhrbacteria bacterium]